MSIFNKSLSNINEEDLQELITNKAVENIRLEFKRDEPSKEQIFKKVSSFANTFGGYIIIGIEEDGNGIASKIKGVNEIPGFKQKVTQFCFDNIHPPLSVSISDPIPLLNSKFCYVIYINQSHNTPHFINGRKGCYVRTDEFSQKFTPELATYDELTNLSESRKRYVRKRSDLLIRAESRFDSHASLNYDVTSDNKSSMNSTFSFSIIPSMVYSNIIGESELKEFISGSKIDARQVKIPSGFAQSQHEGFFFPNPRGDEFSYLEVDIYGMIYYAMGISENYNDEILINGSKLLGWILFYLTYAQKFYEEIGFKGLLFIKTKLEGIQGVKFFKWGTRLERHILDGSPFDDKLAIETEISKRKLDSNLFPIVGDLFKKITFAMGWYDVFDEVKKEDVNFAIDKAKEYLLWN